MSGKTSTASKRLYNEKAYDRISLVVKKGRREELKAYAESKGMSINGYINKLIDEDMKIDFNFLSCVNDVRILDTIVLDKLHNSSLAALSYSRERVPTLHSVSHHLLDGACRGLCGYRPVSEMSMRKNIFTHF